MAGKEATVYIVDCGRSMGKHGNGRQQSNLDWSLQYVWDRITTTVATGRKTALVGVVGLRTDETDNSMSGEEGYENVSVMQNIDQILMPQLRELRDRLQVSSTDSGDAISALAIAMGLIVEKCKKLQYERKIILVTDATGEMDFQMFDEIVGTLREYNIQLVVLGIDFDDADYGYKEDGKDAKKAEKEEELKRLADACGGIVGTMAHAIEEMVEPRVKAIRPTPSYKGTLTLGNNEEYDTALTLQVERYPKVKEAKALGSSKFVAKGDMTSQSMAPPTQSNGDGTGGDLTAIKLAKTYQIEDEKAPGGKKDVDADELSKGYEYGRTAVHMAESDRNVTQFETKAGFDIIGFVERPKYERYLDMSETYLTIAQKGNTKTTMALSSFIHALYEMDSYAAARLVTKDGREPKIVLLAPHIESDLECLYDVEVPFSEDVRGYKFSPLDRVITVSGKQLKTHRNLPNDELTNAISAYVDAMDLSIFEKDDEGQPTEYAAIEDTYNPNLHRINQVIKYRAVYPGVEPPEPPEILLRFSQPPEALVNEAQDALGEILKTANVKRVPPKARGKRYGRGKEAQKPLSDLNVAALLAQDPHRKSKRIDPNNAIPEFKQMLETAEEMDQIQDACNQLKSIIFDWIRHSVGDNSYEKAVEAIGVMREEMIEMEMPAAFNSMMEELKPKLLKGELGGERGSMWYRLRVKKLRPIPKEESQSSEWSEEKAKAFMLPRDDRA